MPELEFAYLLESVNIVIAEQYVKQTFNRSIPAGSGHSVTLFVGGYKTSCPASCLETAKQFPLHSFFVELDDSSSLFIVIANAPRFHNILNFCRGLNCKVLYHAIQIELERDESPEFRLRNESWQMNEPKIMGILNITPDSFYDGGKFYQKSDYAVIAQTMIDQGVDLIDIGGESTRPGSKSVSVKEELDRVLPAVMQIRDRFSLPISVDTVKPEVASVVLEKGADMINDTSGLAGGEKMLSVLKQFNAAYCLMHTQGTPDRMQVDPSYDDVVSEIYRFFQSKVKLLLEFGIDRSRICIDPGIGFGKLFHHNLFLQQFLGVFKSLGFPILLGTSNKSFIGQALNRDVEDRTIGSMVTQVEGWRNGATLFRVHDVKSTRDALKIAQLFHQ